MGKLSVDIHVARACICVYVHADLSDALTFLLGMCRDGDIYDVLSVSALGPNRA